MNLFKLFLFLGLITLSKISTAQTKNSAQTKSNEQTTSTAQNDMIKPDEEKNQLAIYNLFHLSKILATLPNERDKQFQIYYYLKTIPNLAKDKEEIRTENINSAISLIDSGLLTNFKDFLKNNPNADPESFKKTYEFYDNSFNDAFAKLKELKVQKQETKEMIKNNDETLSYLKKSQKNLEEQIKTKIIPEDSLKNWKENLNKNKLTYNFLSQKLLSDQFITIDSNLSDISIHNNINLINELKEKMKSDSAMIESEIEKNLKKDSVNAVNLEKEIGTLAKKLKESIPSKITSFNLSDFESLSGQNKAVNYQIQINSSISAAEQNMRSSFSIPSQSDMIHALAIFLANRAKQEMVIWFIERLKKDVGNPIILDAFPKTFMLLQEQATKIPSFGNEWRVALAEDFINMPSHLLQSDWLKNTWAIQNNEAYNYLLQSVELSKEMLSLIQSRYNYRDIIRHFYLKENQNSKPLELFDVLYVIVNEFNNISFQDGKYQIRLLSFEELASLDNNRWNLFLDLLKIKYGNQLPEKLIKLIKQDNNTLDIKPLARLILQLSQFDKLALESVNSKEYADPKSSVSNTVNLWDMLSTIIQTLQTYKIIDQESPAFSNTLNQVLTLYQQIYQGNFDIATKDLIALIKNLKNSDAKTLSLIGNKNGNAKQIQIKNSKETYSINWNHDFIKDQNEIIKYFTEKIKYNDSGFSIFKYNLDADFKKLKSMDPDYFNLGPGPKEALTFLFGEKKFNIEDYQTLLFTLQVFQKDSLLKTSIKNLNLKKIIKDTIQNKIDNINFNNLDKLAKIASFFSDVTSSTDANSLSAAINHHVLPPTSYLLKRTESSTLSINGYVGAQVSYQRYFSISEFNKRFNWGITAPIGLTYSNRKVGLFLSILDLGNLVNQYLWETDEDFKNEKFEFKQVLSPGLSFLYNIPKTPFVAFAGAKVIPLETKTGPNMEKYNTKDFDLLQFVLGIKLDIPFYTYTFR